MDWRLGYTSTNELHMRIEANTNTSHQGCQHIRGAYLRSPDRGRSAPFYGRLRNCRAPASGTAHAAICPGVLDGDMAVIWQDPMPIPAHFLSGPGRIWAPRRMALCTAACGPAIGRYQSRGIGSCAMPGILYLFGSVCMPRHHDANARCDAHAIQCAALWPH